MNAHRLLGLYKRIADAPDAVGRLRRFVLDLAVRGKLVPQDPAEEPASELLKRIAKEKARLVKAGEIRRDGPPIEIDQGEFPLIAPYGWILTRLATISRRIHYGYTASADAALKDVRMLRITDIQENAVDWESVPGCAIDPKSVDQYRLAKGDILIARTGGTIGKTFLVGAVPLAAVFASYLIRVQGTSNVFDQFLKLFLESSLYWTQLYDGARGTGQPNVNGQTLGRLILPLPPLAEQRRIVAKVDELMALCDRLEAARAEREATRDRLAAASLARLNAPDPDTFTGDARFALNTLPALTTRPDQIKQLRQTILNLAVRGKLVPQDPADEPASELLKRIAKEKARHGGKAARGRRSDGRERTEDFAFVPPPGWATSTLGEVALKITDGAHQTPTYVPSGIPFVSIKDFSNGQLNLSNTRYITEEEHRGLYERCDPKRGDILIGRIGTLGRAVLVDTDVEFSLFVSVGLIRFSHTNIAADFFRLLLNSPLIGGEFDRIKVGGGTHTNKLNLGDLKTVALPLPPLAEQHRILAKVDDLMALCDQLEASLTTGDATRRRLLDALLAEALAPETMEEEAA